MAAGRNVDLTINCSALGAGEVTDRLLGIAANEYKAVKVGANQFQFQRVYRPTWALVLGIVLIPVLVGIILLVFVRSTEQWVATLEEDHRSVRVRVHGTVLPAVLTGIQQALGAGPAAGPIGPVSGITADPVGVDPTAMGSPLNLPPPTGTPTGTPLNLPPPTGTPTGTPLNLPPPTGTPTSAPLNLPAPTSAPPPSPAPAPVSSFAPPASAPPTPSAPVPPPASPPAPSGPRDPDPPENVQRSTTGVSIAPPPAGGLSPNGSPDDGDGLDPAVERTSLTPADLSAEVATPPSGSITLTFDTGEVLIAEPRMLVGRDPEVADGDPPARLVPIADTDRSVSKTHLVVEAADDGVTVTDRGSTNGTSVTRPDGATEALTPEEPNKVPFGSTVTFGQRSFTVAPTLGNHQR